MSKDNACICDTTDSICDKCLEEAGFIGYFTITTGKKNND